MSGKAWTQRTLQRARDAFLAELAKRGNVSEACRAAEVPRSTAYQWKAADEAFAAAWNEALEVACDAMEGEAWRRAVEGTEEPVYGRVGKDKDGQIGTVRKYSDTLMVKLLQAHRPEKYRERQDVQHSGGVTVRVVYDDDADA